MSAHIGGSSGEYVGIINGITYRINLDADASRHGTFGLVPVEMQPLSTAERLALSGASPADNIELDEAVPAIAVATVSTPTTDVLMDQTRAEKAARAAQLFKREGWEPLRAGQPDLWALLVAGTCLEGSAFLAA